MSSRLSTGVSNIGTMHAVLRMACNLVTRHTRGGERDGRFRARAVPRFLLAVLCACPVLLPVHVPLHLPGRRASLEVPGLAGAGQRSEASLSTSDTRAT